MIKPHITDYDFPGDLKDMTPDELNILSYEIRDFLLETVSKTGGHLASNLGVVELSIALHKVFDSPRDKIVWDVGHQAYVHKILTGRAGRFDTLRQLGGLSGFPRGCESESDVLSSGHSSVAISAASGLAAARVLSDDDYSVVCVIGDGAMTGGLAYEGLNNAGSRKLPMIVVLNDNEQSISKNTGSIAKYLRRLRTTHKYTDMKASVKDALQKVPGIGSGLFKGLDSLKDVVYSAAVEPSIFDDLGFKYFGPVDGHDIDALCEVLEVARELDRPVLIHAVTTKGKGYINAEKHPAKYHGVGPFDPETGAPTVIARSEATKQSSDRNDNPGTGLLRYARNDDGVASRSWSDTAGGILADLAREDDKIVCITAAMCEGTGLERFALEFPDRFFDVGIAEEHAVVFAAGLAAAGYKPVFCCYSTFLQRAYDQILSDVALHKLPVLFMVDRAGCVGQDGETHHGLRDIAYLSQVPGMTLLSPSSESQMTEFIRESLSHQTVIARSEATKQSSDLNDSPDTGLLRFARNDVLGPVAIRYPRGGPEPLDRSSLITDRPEAVILSTGIMTYVAASASRLLSDAGFDVSVYEMTRIHPLDTPLLDEISALGVPVFTLEDGAVYGGFGEAVCAYYSSKVDAPKVTVLGWPNEFIPHGTVEELRREYGLDAQSIASRIREAV